MDSTQTRAQTSNKSVLKCCPRRAHNIFYILSRWRFRCIHLAVMSRCSTPKIVNDIRLDDATVKWDTSQILNLSNTNHTVNETIDFLELWLWYFQSILLSLWQIKFVKCWFLTVVVVQMAQRYLSKPQMCGSIPVIGSFYIEGFLMSTVLNIPNWRKRPGKAHLKKTNYTFRFVLSILFFFFFFKKWANPGLFFCLFSSFQHATI